jgi:hypothetical protein
MSNYYFTSKKGQKGHRQVFLYELSMSKKTLFSPEKLACPLFLFPFSLRLIYFEVLLIYY